MTLAQSRDEMIRRGLLTEAEYIAGIALLDEPSVIDLFANVAAWGRRPPKSSPTQD
jgi:hypothetical protein